MDPFPRRHLFLLIALAAAAFLPALDGRFLLWDDSEFVENNPLVRPVDGAAVRDIFDPARIGEVEGIYIPLTDLSLALDRTLFGPGPRGFHAVNVALHVLAVVLLYLCFLRVPLAPWGAFAAAAVFAVHPVHVESVAWASCRKDVLSMVFFAAALLAGMDASFEADRRGRRAAIAAVLFACALLAKPTTVVLPVLLFLWAATRGRARASLVAVVPLLALSAAGVALSVWMGGRHGIVRGEVVAGLDERLLRMTRVFPRYVWNLAFPTGLSARYDWASFGEGFDGATAASLAVCGAWAAATLLAVRRAPRLFVGLAWVTVALAPVAQVVPTGLYMADKYLHIPSIGACLVFALAVGELTPTRGWALGALLAVFGVLTWSRCETWRDTGKLLADAMERAPRSVDVHLGLGMEYHRHGDLDRAERALRRAAAIAPGFHAVWHRLAVLEWQQGRIEEAATDLARCLALSGGYAPASHDLGRLRASQGRDREAEELLRAAVVRAPLSASYREGLAEFLLLRRRAEDALAAIEETDLRSPGLALARGNALLLLGRAEEAERAWREGIGMDASRIELRSNLAKVLIDRGALAEAGDQVRAGLTVAPENAGLRTQLGLVELREGRVADAIEELRKATQAAPGLLPAGVLLARAYELAGDRESALAAWRAVLSIAPDDAEAKKQIEELNRSQ